MELTTIIGIAVVVLIIVGFVFLNRGSSKPKPSPYARVPEIKKPTGPAAPTTVKAQSSVEIDESLLTPLPIYYGSQTGTAEKFAKQLAKAGPKHGFKAKAIDIENFKPETLMAGGLSIFLMATCGEGDPTDNAIQFTKWLKGETDATMLTKLRFTVFGLGSRQYEHYNKMGKITNTGLEALGAVRVYTYGEGNDDGTMEEDFEAWRANLWPALKAAAGGDLSGAIGAGAGTTTMNGHSASSTSAGSGGASAMPTANSDEEEDPVPALVWEVQRVPAGTPLPVPGSPAMTDLAAQAEVTARPYFTYRVGRITCNRELTQRHTEETMKRHIEIDLTGTGLTYHTADNLHILPENDMGLVTALASQQGYDLKELFTLNPVPNSDGDVPKPLFPTPCTVRDALAYYLDLTGKPDRAMLAALATFAGSPEEQSRLKQLADRRNKQEYKTWVEDAHRGIHEIFSTFRSIRIPFNVLLHVLPRLRSREYTIASSSTVHPTTVHLAVSIVNDPKPEPAGSVASTASTASISTASPRRLHGVCTTFLERATVGTPVRITVSTSTFRLPPPGPTPVIMVGPGTGFAPMRAFLQELHHRKTVLRQPVGPAVLFFGCRRSDEDFIYKEEILEYGRNGTAHAIHLAFSRESTHRCYVQDKMREAQHELWDLINNKGGYVYVCGATRMGKDVSATLEEMVEAETGGDRTSAAQYIQRLQREHRYIAELWS